MRTRPQQGLEPITLGQSKQLLSHGKVRLLSLLLIRYDPMCVGAGSRKVNLAAARAWCLSWKPGNDTSAFQERQVQRSLARDLAGRRTSTSVTTWSGSVTVTPHAADRSSPVFLFLLVRGLATITYVRIDLCAIVRAYA